MQYTENWGSYYKAKHIFFLINMSSDENLGFCAILLNVVYKSLSISFWRCLPMLGPLGEDFAKVKASITTALDKITQVFFFDSVKIRWPILEQSWSTCPFQSWNLRFKVSKTYHCHPLIFLQKLEYEYGINCPKTRSVDDILESSRNSLSPGFHISSSSNEILHRELARLYLFLF